MRPKDTLEPTKQDRVVYKIPCECGKVYIGETGRAMQERIKEHDRDMRFACTQTSAISEDVKETGIYSFGTKSSLFIDIRLHTNNINRDSGIDTPEARITTIGKHNSRSVRMREQRHTVRIIMRIEMHR